MELKLLSLRNTLFIAVWLVGAISGSFAQGIEFFHGKWEEVLLKAKSEDKLIFVDAYTTWCGPCKRMAANTFPDQEVGDFFNTYFVNFKIDMESPDGIAFGRKYEVTAYPTLFFIAPDGELVQRSTGAKDPAGLIALGKQVTGKYDWSGKFEEAYAAGERSYELVFSYVAALNKAEKSSVKIVNDYLADQQDITTPENLKFILEGASIVDCTCFDLFEQYKSQIASVVPEQVIHDKVKQACERTVRRAMEYESRELLNQATAAMKRHVPGEADSFKTRSEINYALAVRELSDVSNLVQYHLKKHLKGDAQGMHLLALDLQKFGAGDPACRDLAIDLAGKAVKEEEKAEFVMTYASMLYDTGKKSEAIKLLDDVIRKRTDDNSKEYRNLIGLRNKFQHS